MSASCNRGSSCSLTRAMDDRIVCCGIIRSCQSAATSEIVKSASGRESDSCKRRYSKYPTFTFTLKNIQTSTCSAHVSVCLFVCDSER